MRFVEIPLSGIIKFISSEEFLNGPVIPITPLRAISHSMNPRGNPDDIILILAYNENDELIGYIGSLPDHINLIAGQRVAWNSCWWVDPVQGKETAMQLFYRFLDRWKKQVLFADLTPLTYNIISKTGFFQTRIKTGTRGYLRMPLSEILPPKNQVFRSFKWFFSAFDFIFNIFWEIRLKIWKDRNKMDEKINWAFIWDLDPGIAGLMQKESTGDLIGRGEAELNWIRDYPWISHVKDKVYASRYNFTYYARRFEHHRIKITENNQIKAFLIITIRNNHLKVPYLFYEKDSLSQVMNFLLHFMITSRIHYISVFRKDLAEFLFKNPAPMIWKKRIPRYTAISKDIFSILPEEYQSQDGDGDCVFT